MGVFIVQDSEGQIVTKTTTGILSIKQGIGIHENCSAFWYVNAYFPVRMSIDELTEKFLEAEHPGAKVDLTAFTGPDIGIKDPVLLKEAAQLVKKLAKKEPDIPHHNLPSDTPSSAENQTA